MFEHLIFSALYEAQRKTRMMQQLRAELAQVQMLLQKERFERRNAIKKLQSQLTELHAIVFPAPIIFI